jgi:hypothetical protein
MPRKKTTPAAATAAPAILSLAEATALSTSAATEQFVTEYKNRRASFVRQGKLVYALKEAKLPRNQSVYSILQSQGVPEGSVHQAVMTAELLKELVVAGHLEEARFDEVATYNVVRRARQLCKGKGAVKLQPADIANLMKEGTSAQIGSELQCLVEHGQTQAEREAALEAEAAEKERQAAAAKAADELKAQEAENLKAELAAAQAERDRLAAEAAEKAKADEEAAARLRQVPIEDASAPAVTAEEPEEEADPAEEEEEDPAEEEADEEADPSEDEEEADEEVEEEEEPEAAAPPVVVAAAKPAGSSAPPPPAPVATLADITARVDELLLEALALDAEDMARLVQFLRKSANDLADTIPAQLKVA